MPKGIYTNIYKIFDDQGIELSGGESQKLALARSLYRNSPIVILDEPTAALDPKSEMMLYSKFNDMTKNKTAFYISHRLLSTRFCDKIIVLDKGHIEECGTHPELIKNRGAYYNLYNMQSNQLSGMI